MEPHPWCQLTASALTGSLSRGRLTQATVSGERTSLSGIWLCGFPAHHAPAGQQTSLFLHLQLVPSLGREPHSPPTVLILIRSKNPFSSSSCLWPELRRPVLPVHCLSCPLSLRGGPLGSKV